MTKTVEIVVILLITLGLASGVGYALSGGIQGMTGHTLNIITGADSN